MLVHQIIVACQEHHNTAARQQRLASLKAANAERRGLKVLHRQPPHLLPSKKPGNTSKLYPHNQTHTMLLDGDANAYYSTRVVLPMRDGSPTVYTIRAGVDDRGADDFCQGSGSSQNAAAGPHELQFKQLYEMNALHEPEDWEYEVELVQGAPRPLPSHLAMQQKQQGLVDPATTTAQGAFEAPPAVPAAAAKNACNGCHYGSYTEERSDQDLKLSALVNMLQTRLGKTEENLSALR